MVRTTGNRRRIFGGAHMTNTNQLYYGDNLQVLRENFPDESLDLIYLDPPFNSQASYNILFRAPTSEQSKAQIEAFEDNWHWNDHAERAFDEVIHRGNIDAAEMLRAMRAFPKENDMIAYLIMMAVRLIELHRVLKTTGSLYLHCDPTASHYLKHILDGVFGSRQFKNDLIWRRGTPQGHAYTRYTSSHDVIFYYAKSGALSAIFLGIASTSGKSAQYPRRTDQRRNLQAKRRSPYAQSSPVSGYWRLRSSQDGGSLRNRRRKGRKARERSFPSWPRGRRAHYLAG
jgi:hypothetical protein